MKVLCVPELCARSVHTRGTCYGGACCLQMTVLFIPRP